MAHKITPIFILLVIIVSCGKKKDEEAVSYDIATTVESAISGIGGTMDESSNEDSSFAAVCSDRAVAQSCSSSTRAKTYSNCTIGATSLELSGTVTLGYSESDCLINATNETVTRTYDLTRDTVFGGTVTVSSATHTSYDGTSVSGGGRLTKTAAGWDIDILGKRRVRKNAKGKSVLDISLKTQSPIKLTGGILRSLRNLDGGSLSVYNNLAKYTATMVPNNITYSTSCCYPTGGTVSTTYSGSITGSATVTFNSCASATVNKDGTNYDVTFYSCE